MAPGKHGGYRDNEFMDCESNFDVSRRVYYNDSKEEYDRIRIKNGSRDSARGGSRDARDKIRLRQKDTRERKASNGSRWSTSSRSDSGSSGSRSGGVGPRRCGFSVKTMDREPGELSSESGSDDGIESESRGKYTEVATGEENGTRFLVDRKRKFSPIVWDQDDREVNNLSKLGVATAASALPQPPSFPRIHQIPFGPYSGVETHPVKNTEAENLELPTATNFPLLSKSVQDTESESPVGLHSLLPGQKWGHELEAEQPEGEDYIPTHNISSSRWAAGDNSPGDEGEINDDKEIHERRRKISPELVKRVRNKISRQEESKIDGFEGARAKSSESEERGSHGRSSSGDDHSGIESEKDDYMEIDGQGHKSETSGSHLDTDSEDDSRETPEPPAAPQRVVNMLQGCRSVDEFERLNKINEGTYGIVFRAKDKKTGEIVALKKVKMEKEKEGFPMTSLREINILLSFHHRSIVDVKEVVVGSSLDSIFMVMEYMEHDLKGLMEAMKQPFSQSEVKCLMLQLLEGMKYLHDNWVLHRDLKTSNLLLNNRGELKICDFGLARQYGSPLKPYTHLVVTLWYRAPELLLGKKQYSTAIDMWSLGCIMAELLSKEPLFNGKTEFDQLDKIFRILGTPNEAIWPGFSELPRAKVKFVKHQYNLLRKKFPATSFTGSPVLSDSGFDLLNKLLTYDPEKRITAEEALNHEWFREVPLPKSKEFMPTFPAQHAQDRRTRRILKSPDPLAEQYQKELQQGESGTGGIFG
ncbi:cyclin-dependent kinase G-2-like [Abrus precatorius]|uniref:cyclin-dependent kinase n=1 Tax=Abrus precatorius TaxID=3816 RepID=A0A8B8JR80_ABRPR|nr:cyclin-dependent kinase G-2-like [Abrus precatorius]